MSLTVSQRAALWRLASQGMSDPQIAARLGVSARTVLRWRIASGIPSQWTPPTPVCGTLAAYRHGCRCDLCNRANAAHLRAYVATQQSRTAGGRNWRLPWTPAEDRTALAWTGTRSDLALHLGRTYSGVTQRLAYLHRAGDK